MEDEVSASIRTQERLPMVADRNQVWMRGRSQGQRRENEKDEQGHFARFCSWRAWSRQGGGLVKRGSNAGSRWATDWPIGSFCDTRPGACLLLLAWYMPSM